MMSDNRLANHCRVVYRFYIICHGPRAVATKEQDAHNQTTDTGDHGCIAEHLQDRVHDFTIRIDGLDSQQSNVGVQ